MNTLQKQNERLAQILLQEIQVTVKTRTSGVISESEMMDRLIPLINMADSLPKTIQIINKEK
jgi:hypothetical protein